MADPDRLVKVTMENTGEVIPVEMGPVYPFDKVDATRLREKVTGRARTRGGPGLSILFLRWWCGWIQPRGRQINLAELPSAAADHPDHSV